MGQVAAAAMAAARQNDGVFHGSSVDSGTRHFTGFSQALTEMVGRACGTASTSAAPTTTGRAR